MDPSQLPAWAAIKVVTVSLGRSFMHPWAERKLMKRINAARLGIGNSFLLLTDEQQPATTTRYIQYICVQEQQPFPQHFPHCYHFHLRPFIWKWDTQWLRMGSDYHLTVCIVLPSSSLCPLCVCACACVLTFLFCDIFYENSIQTDPEAWGRGRASKHSHSMTSLKFTTIDEQVKWRKQREGERVWWVRAVTVVGVGVHL